MSKYLILIFVSLFAPAIGVLKSEKNECASPETLCNPKLQQACCEAHTKCTFLFNSYICTEECKLGDYCSTNENCSHIPHSVCLEKNQCGCSFDSVRINDSCVLKLRGICKNNEKCATVNSACIGNECQCKPGYFEFINECVSKSKKFKVPYCNSYLQCNVKNSECVFDQCQCKKNYVLVSDNECKKRADLLDSCTEDSECNKIKFCLCENNRCQCRTNYMAINGTCLARLGGYCFRNEDCSTKNAWCIENKCQCESLRKPNDEQCPEVDLLGKLCNASSHCRFIKHSKCFVNKCICKENYSAHGNSMCLPNLNEPCSNDNPCSFKNFHCVDNKCQCKPKFISVSVSQCIEEHYVFSCNESLDCSDPWHSMCSADNKCVCQSNNLAAGRSCLPVLGGKCWKNDQCVSENSECVDYHCECKYGFVRVAENFCMFDN